MVNELKYPEEVQKKIDEKLQQIRMKNKDKTYGDWTKADADSIDEAKLALFEQARQSLENIGVDIENQDIEWIVKPLNENQVTVAWKTVVTSNG